ncbi:MAG: hypothetical protein QM778_10640 [Myxococcales bacterium]
MMYDDRSGSNGGERRLALESRRRFGWGALGALALLILALMPVRVATAGVQQTDELALIIGSATGVSDIPSDVVRTAFLGLRAEYHGIRLIPLNLPLRTPARERLDRALLGLAPEEVGSFWIDQRVRDGRNPPRTAPSVELAVRIVAQLKGAIACVPLASLDPRTRALRIDGKGPSESGYLLSRGE